MRRRVFFGLFLAATMGLPSRSPAEIDADALQRLGAAAPSGERDQTELAAAWRDVAQATLDDLPQLLSAFEGATPVGENWLSLAMDRVLQAAADDGKVPPTDLLADFVLEASNGARGREAAFELLRSQDAERAAIVTARLIKDPVARLRAPAVDALIETAKATEEPAERLQLYQQAFAAALDEDHVGQTAAALRELGHPVDHIRKFGFLMHWQIIGPFDYQDGEGFDIAYPPESLSLASYDGDEGIYADKQYDGKEQKVVWREYINTARNGVVDLNKAIAEIRDVVGYGATVYESARDQQVELRLRQQNSCKLWLNGELVFSQPVGHTGNFFDQYTVPVTLRKGPNLIVIKSCQIAGPVYHPFVNAWQFCVRVTDTTGNALLAVNRPATPELDPLPSARADESDKSDTSDSEGNEPS